MGAYYVGVGWLSTGAWTGSLLAFPVVEQVRANLRVTEGRSSLENPGEGCERPVVDSHVPVPHLHIPEYPQLRPVLQGHLVVHFPHMALFDQGGGILGTKSMGLLATKTGPRVTYRPPHILGKSFLSLPIRC